MVTFQRELLPPMVKATKPILVQTVAVMRRLDHAANRTGKPARNLPDGKQTKRIGTGNAGHCSIVSAQNETGSDTAASRCLVRLW
jgi:hypothetical protein